MALLVDVSREIAKNVGMGIPPVRRLRLKRARAGADISSSDEQLKRYAFQALDALQQHVGGVRGRSVIEIGPGDLLTSGMALLAGGASSYTSVDRFVGDYSRAEGRHWYAAIQQAWPRLYPDQPWPAWLDAADFPEGYPDRVRALEVPIERADSRLRADIVCSFQVGEHVSDIRAFATATDAMLNPGGVALHRIDFGPHDVWSRYDDPLVFLRFPDLLWKAMGSNRGTPNRHRSGELLAAFEATSLTIEVAGVERLPAERVDLAKLHPRYRQMAPEDVLVQTVYLIARKA